MPASDSKGEPAVRYSLELTQGTARDTVLLEGPRMTLGRHPRNDVTLSGDGSISRIHAALEYRTCGWYLQDLRSRNGTLVNGERITGERLLRHGDEVRIGATRLRFDAIAAEPATETSNQGEPPVLTPPERAVLVALCRPALAGGPQHEPASVHRIALELGVGEQVVDQHLLHLYAKFQIADGTALRRVRLAKAAVLRGAVTREQVEPASRPGRWLGARRGTRA
jgi:pSer/pThr/pTyr-binding forkhead associated (FHA) protein